MHVSVFGGPISRSACACCVVFWGDGFEMAVTYKKASQEASTPRARRALAPNVEMYDRKMAAACGAISAEDAAFLCAGDNHRTRLQQDTNLPQAARSQRNNVLSSDSVHHAQKSCPPCISSSASPPPPSSSSPSSSSPASSAALPPISFFFRNLRRDRKHLKIKRGGERVAGGLQVGVHGG